MQAAIVTADAPDMLHALEQKAATGSRLQACTLVNAYFRTSPTSRGKGASFSQELKDTKILIL
jgi:hypothetical protein